MLHAVSQGVVSDLRGDKFVHGAVSGIVAKIGGAHAEGLGDFASTVVVATFGGLASSAVGGDFTQGAMNAAIVHLFNELGERCSQCTLVPRASDGKLMWVHIDSKMAAEAKAESKAVYDETTKQEYANALGLVGAFSPINFTSKVLIGATAVTLDDSFNNQLGLFLTIMIKPASIIDNYAFFGGNVIEGTVDNVGKLNDAYSIQQMVGE